jgi:hypothetical protein
MGKVIEFLNVPTVPGGNHAREERACEHTKLTFTKNLVECRSCGRQWKDYGTGGKQ